MLTTLDLWFGGCGTLVSQMNDFDPVGDAPPAGWECANVWARPEVFDSPRWLNVGVASMP